MFVIILQLNPNSLVYRKWHSVPQPTADVRFKFWTQLDQSAMLSSLEESLNLPQMPFKWALLILVKNNSYVQWLSRLIGLI